MWPAGTSIMSTRPSSPPLLSTRARQPRKSTTAVGTAGVVVMGRASPLPRIAAADKADRSIVIGDDRPAPPACLPRRGHAPLVQRRGGGTALHAVERLPAHHQPRARARRHAARPRRASG